MPVSIDRARHAITLLRAMHAGGFLGTDPETAEALRDLTEFVEESETPTSEVHRGEKDAEAESPELPEDPARE